MKPTIEDYRKFVKELVNILDDVHCYPDEIFNEETGVEKEILKECGYGWIFGEEE